MLKLRTKRRTGQRDHAAQRFSQTKISIALLGDEDLLDLADIFKSQKKSPLFEVASAEMERRGIKLEED